MGELGERLSITFIFTCKNKQIILEYRHMLYVT